MNTHRSEMLVYFTLTEGLFFIITYNDVLVNNLVKKKKVIYICIPLLIA